MGIKRAAGSVVGLVLIVLLAGWLGRVVGHYLNEQESAHMESWREKYDGEFRARIEAASDSVDFFQYPFVDLDGEPITLGQLIHGRSLVVFTKPGCEGCADELKWLRERVADVSDSSRLIFVIIEGDAYDIRDVQEVFGRTCRCVRDTGDFLRIFSDTLMFPLNFVVDSSLQIEQVFPGRPRPGTLNKIYVGGTGE